MWIIAVIYWIILGVIWLGILGVYLLAYLPVILSPLRVIGITVEWAEPVPPMNDPHQPPEPL